MAHGYEQSVLKGQMWTERRMKCSECLYEHVQVICTSLTVCERHTLTPPPSAL